MNLALFGSGEFTDQVNDIDKYLISKFKPKNIAVLPTAAGAEADVNKWIEMAKEHYGKFNLKVIPVPILNNADANQRYLVSLLEPADWIFFSGGDPGYLLDCLIDSKLWKVIASKLENGCLISGSSAGAMVMGNYLLSLSFRRVGKDSKMLWKNGLEIVDYTIIPHFDHFKRNKGFIRKMIKLSPKEVKASWMGIDENTAIIFSGGECVVHGLGNVEIHAGRKTTVIKSTKA